MPKKPVIRVVLNEEEKRILDIICTKLGQTESQTMRYAFKSYAKDIGMIEEWVHGGFQKSSKDQKPQNE